MPDGWFIMMTIIEFKEDTAWIYYSLTLKPSGKDFFFN